MGGLDLTSRPVVSLGEAERLGSRRTALTTRHGWCGIAREDHDSGFRERLALIKVQCNVDYPPQDRYDDLVCSTESYDTK